MSRRVSSNGQALSRVCPCKLIEGKYGKGAKQWDGDKPSVITHAVWSLEAKSLSPLSIAGEQFWGNGVKLKR